MSQIISKTEGVSGSNGQGARLVMADGSIWFHPYNGGAPVKERSDSEIHYALSFEEVRAMRFIDRGDYLACPPKACASGDFHALHSRDWAAVTCPACQAKNPAK